MIQGVISHQMHSNENIGRPISKHSKKEKSFSNKNEKCSQNPAKKHLPYVIQGMKPNP